MLVLSSDFCSLFNTGVHQALANGCASVREPISSTPSSTSEIDAPALGSHFCSLSNVGVTDALASGSRILLHSQRWRWSSASKMDTPASGSRMMPPIPNTDVPQAPVKRMRQRQGANFLLPFQRQRSAPHPLSLPMILTSAPKGCWNGLL